MKKELTLKDIAGYATERMVWQLMLYLSDGCNQGKLYDISPDRIIIQGKDFLLNNNGAAPAGKAFAAPESFSHKTVLQEVSDVWTMGALAFYAITGTDVFEGKGGETQDRDTEVPRLSSAHASQDLSTLVRRCLNYTPGERPARDEIRQMAQEKLAVRTLPSKKLLGKVGKGYTSSLIKFWPEEMIPFILVILLLLSPCCLSAQQKAAFNKSVIPNEMAALVLRCTDLRSPQNMAKVSKSMDRDMNWTMMDELSVDKEGECSTKDIVDMFGLNDIGFGILKRHGGVTNAGGRFRDGRDPRYKYSFIEVTVKVGKSVNYAINGREGEQLFAIVPFEKDAQFKASIPKGETFTDEGICYIRLKQGIKKTDSFTLTIKNESGKNMAFAIINYNSRNHE